MNNEIKEQLIKAISDYEGNKALILRTSEKEITLYEILSNEGLTKKMLIENQYGILGNLLYKYYHLLDKDIIIELILKDRNRYEDYNKLLGISYLLNTNKLLAIEILTEYEDVDKLVKAFGIFIINSMNPINKENREFILRLIENNTDVDLFNILYYLKEEFKKDKELVYKAFKHSNLISNFNYQDKTLKELYLEVLTNVEILDKEVMKSLKVGVPQIGTPKILISILPNELKSDVELIKKFIWVSHHYIFEKEVKTIKELYLEYANELKYQLENNGYIYIDKLPFSTYFPEELLNDQEFVISIIEYDDEYDQEKLYERYNITRVYEEEELDEEEEQLLEKYEQSDRYRMRGKSYMKKYDFEAAICMFESGFETFPYYHGCYVDKADCLVKLGKLDEAISFLKEIINSEELKNADKSCYKICSNDYTYTNYTSKLFFSKLEDKLLDTEKKKERGYVYRPKYKHFY